MTARQTSLVYDEEQTDKATEGAYRTGINAADGVDLSVPISLQASFGRQNLAVSCRFSNPTDQADVHVITYGRRSDGTRYALGVQNVIGLTPGPFREDATLPYHAEVQFFDMTGAALWEVRFQNVVGTIDNVFAWAF